MSRKQLFKTLAETIITGMPAIKRVSRYKRQFEEDTDENTASFPWIAVQFADTGYENQSSCGQKAKAEVIFHISHDEYKYSYMDRLEGNTFLHEDGFDVDDLSDELWKILSHSGMMLERIGDSDIRQVGKVRTIQSRYRVTYAVCC
ncbi:hypothetical protein V6R21_20320 [Limibacter armeniacum]|uniref:hypothetical protein n=1 Tax=Limibacter armeniacum TaxID=466084 RepID=UPI002FE67352